MPLQLRWVGEQELDRVALTRMRCYAPAVKQLETFQQGIRADQRAVPGDFLLAESGAEALGTATSMSLHMWVRGGRVPVQGVAYVGTVRTARRAGGAEKGIATQVMHATLARAREREQVASALMPFRASFYEHFGYGLAERRTDWIVPLSIMPSGPADAFDYAEAADRPAIAACRQRSVERGQCDIETSPAGWSVRERQYENGFDIIQRSGDGVSTWAYLTSDVREGRSVLRVASYAFDQTDSLRALLAFLAAQRDQHAAAWLTLPGDWPLHRLLREVQMPHRSVTHAFAQEFPFTRMQLRVLDHKRFLEAMHLPARWRGSCEVAVRETEQTVSRFRIDIDAGRVSVRQSRSQPAVECTDVVWASIASGDLAAQTAARLGLISVHDAAALAVLDAFADGPVPFCDEYF